MGKGLIVVESAAKAKTIGKFLDNKYIIKASIGHLRDLPKNSLGVDVENNFKAKYVTDRQKSKIIKELKEAAKSANEVYLATDSDREGEAIAWHLAELLKKEIKGKNVHRITFNEITRNAIKNGIKNPRSIDENIVNAQQARRILDRIVGYKISPLLWKVITKQLSAGRVQSVALRIICEREEEIRAFVPEEYWSIEAEFTNCDADDRFLPFKANLVNWDGKKPEIPNAEEADSILNEIVKSDYKISKIKKTQRKIQPYPAYITSTLQQDSSRILYFTAKRTMQIAQQLYEGIDLGGETVGLISYMRTDSVRLADEAIEACRKLISERFDLVEKNKSYLNSTVRKYSNKNKSQDAHEAIRPTNPFRTPESVAPYLSKDQLKLYTLIWQRFIATQMKPIELDSITLEIEAGRALFRTNGSTITFDGFKKVFNHINISLGSEIDSRYVEGLVVEPINENPKNIQHFTKPPARFTEAALIKELESKGIGRPSTYAMITNTIQVRKYVEVVKKHFNPTELGFAVNKFLINNFDKLFNVKFTSSMEENLDRIEFGKINWIDLLSDNYKTIEELIGGIDIKASKKQMVEETDIVCEKCGSKMLIRWSNKGQFLACSDYPKCSNIKNFKKNKDGKIEIIAPEKIEKKCPKCESDLIVKEGRYGKFVACSNYPKCKHTEPYTLGIKCPKCNEGEITEKRSKKGRVFYGCSSYPKCDFMTYNKPLPIECPECGNHYVEEKKNKDKELVKVCPKCNKELY